MKTVFAIILSALVLLAINYLPYSLFGVMLIVIIAWGQLEFANMFKLNKSLHIVFGVIVGASLIIFQPSIAIFSTIIMLFVLLLIAMFGKNELAENLKKFAYGWFGISYISLTIPFWFWTRGLSYGKELILLGLVPACLTDTFGYLVGKSLGKHKLLPKISPNKTIEGFVGALFGSFIGVFAVKYYLIPGFPDSYAATLAVIIWITAPLGDLVESFIKRSAGVKDSGTIIPGHGGILDRLDALIFVGPVLYFFSKLVLQ